MDIDRRPYKKFRQGFIGASAAAGGGARTSNRFLCSWFLLWGDGGGVSRGRAEGVAEVVCPPLWWCCVQGAGAVVPCFCSLLFGSGSWVLLVFLYLIVYNLPQLGMHAVIFGRL